MTHPTGAETLDAVKIRRAAKRADVPADRGTGIPGSHSSPSRSA